MEAAEDRLEYVKAAPADAVAVPEPVKALKAASVQAPQSPTSAYRPGAFDKHALAAPAAAAPTKPAKKWFSFSKSKSSRYAAPPMPRARCYDFLPQPIMQETGC